MANPEDLGRYRLKRLLGRGLRGEVWEAGDGDDSAGAKVAVKIMHAADDELMAARLHFAREARLASVLRHPNLVVIHDAGEAAGTSFLVMDMVEGPSLRALLDDPAATPSIEDKLLWLEQIAAGLGAMHRAGIAHRDVKPENVIVRADRTACLVDLGICKWTKYDLGGELDPMQDITAPAEPAMPPEYVPPEMTSESVYDELGDQYAWGVLAYEVLTGELPREGAPPLAERPGIGHAVAEAIDRARSSRRTERWDAMTDVVAKLAARSTEAREEASSPVAPEGPPPATAPAGRVPPIVIALAVVFVALTAAVVFALR